MAYCSFEDCGNEPRKGSEMCVYHYDAHISVWLLTLAEAADYIDRGMAMEFAIVRAKKTVDLERTLFWTIDEDSEHQEGLCPVRPNFVGERAFRENHIDWESIARFSGRKKS